MSAAVVRSADTVDVARHLFAESGEHGQGDGQTMATAATLAEPGAGQRLVVRETVTASERLFRGVANWAKKLAMSAGRSPESATTLSRSRAISAALA